METLTELKLVKLDGAGGPCIVASAKLMFPKLLTVTGTSLVLMDDCTGVSGCKPRNESTTAQETADTIRSNAASDMLGSAVAGVSGVEVVAIVDGGTAGASDSGAVTHAGRPRDGRRAVSGWARHWTRALGRVAGILKRKN